MNANEFNSIYDIEVCTPLCRLGFVKKGNSLFMQHGDIYIVLIRNSFRGERVARFLLCLRHSFVRDLSDRKNNLFEVNPNSYPFKIKPFSLNEYDLKIWHYETCSVDDWHYDKINYGEENKIYGGLDDVSTTLQTLRNNIENYYNVWMNMLSPEKALTMLKRYNSGWQTEIDWIEDYKNNIKTHKNN